MAVTMLRILTSTMQSFWRDTVPIPYWETTGLSETPGALALERMDTSELQESQQLNAELTALQLMELSVLVRW